MPEIDEFELSDDSDCEYEKYRREVYKEEIILIPGNSYKQGHKRSKIEKNTRCQNETSKDQIINDKRISFQQTFKSEWKKLKSKCISNVRALKFCDQIRRDAIIVLFMLSIVILMMLNHLQNFNSIAIDGRDRLSWDGIGNLADLYTSLQSNDVPFLWQMPTGTHLLEEILVECFGAHTKNSLSLGLETDLTILTLNSAQSLNKNVMLSPELFRISTIFSPTVHGRLFTLLRHPVYLTFDRYHNLVTNNIIQMPIDKYLYSSYFDDNWITRSITNSEKNDLLSDHHVKFAKEVLRRKCLLGLHENVQEFVNRIERFFRWNDDESVTKIEKIRRETCLSKIIEEQKLIEEEMFSQYPKEGSYVWKLIEKKQKFDMEIFKYAIALFEDEALIKYKIQRQRSKFNSDFVDGK